MRLDEKYEWVWASSEGKGVEPVPAPERRTSEEGWAWFSPKGVQSSEVKAIKREKMEI